jgi:Cdc6-like AAA superfamily ATPase
MTTLNRTHPLRSGFDYQDLWALRLAGEWLMKPESFQWLRSEAVIVDGEFYFDDIVLLDASDKYHLHQAKFKVDSSEEWTWDDFLSPRKGKKGDLPSLLQKWSESFSKLNNGDVQVAKFLTNSVLSSEIAMFVEHNKVNLESIESDDAALFQRILSQTGTQQVAERFFNAFAVIAEESALDALEESVIETFYQQLGATKEGVLNLQTELRKQARRRETVAISIDDIRRWCEFDTPKPLNEDFEIPGDFQFFDKESHASILERLANKEGGVCVLHGNPGCGKSVYLSYLSKELKERDQTVIKHHYHIAPSDASSYERTNTERVIEAIKAQLKSSEHSALLGDLAHANSGTQSLRTYFSTVASNLHVQQQSFVLIVDGLDHVVREKDVDELKNFMDEIFFPQPGLWIVLGTQPQVKRLAQLQSVFNECEEENYIEVRGLGREAVLSIVEQNEQGLTLPELHDIQREFINKLFELSSGNPLHLRYILSYLKKHNGENQVSAYACNDVLPYGDDIHDYYGRLWRSLDADAKSTLLLAASVNFRFEYQQYVECISSFVENPSLVTKSLDAIEHLYTKDSRERLRFFHDSFEVFLLNQEEWKQQRLAILKIARNWLENSANECLKWAELPLIDNVLGDKSTLLEIERPWLISALCDARNHSQIRALLNACHDVSKDNLDFSKSLTFSHLLERLDNATSYLHDTVDQLWVETIAQNPDSIDDLILDELPSEALPLVCKIAYRLGKEYVINESFEILNDRVLYESWQAGQIPSSSKAILQIAPMTPDVDSKRAYDFISGFDGDTSPSLINSYVLALLELNFSEPVGELISFDLSPTEQAAAVSAIASYGFKNANTAFAELIQSCENKSLYGKLYLAIQGPPNLQSCPPRKL